MPISHPWGLPEEEAAPRCYLWECWSWCPERNLVLPMVQDGLTPIEGELTPFPGHHAKPWAEGTTLPSSVRAQGVAGSAKSPELQGGHDAGWQVGMVQSPESEG